MIWEIDDSRPTIEGLDDDGRPDPAYAAALGLLRAPFGRRAFAFVIDSALWLLLQMLLFIGVIPLLTKLATGAISPYGFVNHPSFVLAIVMASVTFALSLVLCVVQLVMHGRRGRTIGKAIVGIRTVNVRTLERPGIGAVLLRYLIVAAAGLLPLFGTALFLISPTFDPDRRGRGWHDKATGVWLVDVRAGLNPYDEKRMRIARKLVKAEPMPERTALPSLATPVDPRAQPEYRPGNRISAGVLGVARPYEPQDRPASAPAPAPSPMPAPSPAAAPSPAPAAARPPQHTPVPEPEPAQPSQHSAAPEPEQAQTPQPAPTPRPATASHPLPAARFGLRFDSGESILISEPVLLGRNPDATDHPGARPIPLADDSRSLSKTHLLVRPVDEGLEIIDCRSTNGSGLIRGGAEYAVSAGVPITTAEGDMIRLGDRVAAVVRV